MDAPKAVAGWHPDPKVSGQLRYWNGDQWTDHTAPADAPPPARAVNASPAMPAATNTVPCPYCKVSISDVATRCQHCGGEQKYCSRCDDLVAMTSKQKFVGIARGGMKTQYRCARCSKVLDGPRF